MNATIRLFVIILIAANLAACSGDPLLRDQYMGRTLIEPELQARPARRDANGDPILDRRERNDFWQSFKFWQTD